MTKHLFKRLAVGFVFSAALAASPAFAQTTTTQSTPTEQSTQTAPADISVAEDVRNQCNVELTKYCSSVTPGRARYAGCLLAHNDKLSEQCEVAFESGLLQLYIIMSTMNYIIDQCGDDIDTHCDGVVVGGGRIAKCLNTNLEKLTPQCKTSFIKAREDLQ